MKVLESSPKKSEYEQVLATVQKAASSGRQLTIDKKGNLKCQGFFSNFFLRLKVSCYSEKGYKQYVEGDRTQVRSKVLKKLEGLARQSRQEAILNARQGSLDPDREKPALDDFLDLYIEKAQENHVKVGLTGIKLSSRDFNSAAADFLSGSKTVTYSRKPVCPDFYDPNKTIANHEGLTGQQKTQIKSYQKSLKAYASTAESKKIIEHSEFREPPNPFPRVPQSRVQFFSGTREAVLRDAEKFGERDGPAKVLEKLDEITYYAAPPRRDMVPQFSSSKTVLNQADFKAQSEKRLLGEVNKRKRLGQEVPQQDISDKAVNFLCFLRKNIQTQLAKDGSLSGQLQTLFNENSAVSVRGSNSSLPDRLIPSKKLAATALDICMGGTETAPAAATEKKGLAFSDDVKVREIDSRHVAKQLRVDAIKDGHLEASRIEKRVIQDSTNDMEDSNPITAEETLTESTFHYEEKDLPDDFEKHVPHGGGGLAAVNFDDGDTSLAEPGLVGGGEERVEVSSGSWLKGQYETWLASEQS